MYDSIFFRDLSFIHLSIHQNLQCKAEFLYCLIEVYFNHFESIMEIMETMGFNMTSLLINFRIYNKNAFI